MRCIRYEAKRESNLMTLSRCSCLLVLLMAVDSALSASPGDSFEVASVKLSADQNPWPGISGLAPPIPSGPLATLYWPHVTLQGMLVRVYPVRYSSLVGPSWIDNTYYDVTAKVPAGVRGQRVAEMVRTLLLERFDMRVRSETKLVKGWALVVGRSPLKLKRTSLPGDPTDVDPDGVPSRSVSVRRKHTVKMVTMKGTSMQGLANAVRVEFGEPVQDSTGLKGAFDVTLEGEMNDPADPMSSMSPASVMRSLRNCGLDLVREKVQLKLLRVVAATRIPKPN